MSSGGFSQKKRRSNGFHIRPTNSGHGATFEFSLKNVQRLVTDASNVPSLDITTVIYLRYLLDLLLPSQTLTTCLFTV